MISPWYMFTIVLATVSGVMVAIFAVLIAVWFFKNVARYIDDFAAAARRYAVRNEVVTEHYTPESMESMRRFESPKPYRVTVAKKKGIKK